MSIIFRMAEGFQYQSMWHGKSIFRGTEASVGLEVRTIFAKPAYRAYAKLESESASTTKRTR